MKRKTLTVIVSAFITLILVTILWNLFVMGGRYRSRWYADKTNNIVLTDFTKELITLYLNDSLFVRFISHDDEVTLVSFTNPPNFYLNLYSNKSEHYKQICYKCFVGDYSYLGKTRYAGLSVRVYGEENSLFFSVHGKAPEQRRCKEEWWEYDPIEWCISFNQDTTFCREKTFLSIEDDDITAIEQLVTRYFP